MRLALLSNAEVIHTRRWGDYFHARGHEVLLISLEPGTGYAYRTEILRSRIPCRFLRYPLAAGRVRRLLVEFRPDVVNAHFVPNYGLIGAMAGVRPLVVSVWGSDVLVSGMASPLHRARVRYVLERADLVTTDAEMLTRAACALGALPERVLTVPMGVDPEPYRVARRAAAEHPDAPPIVISTRKLEPVYNLDQLVEALPAIGAGAPRAEVVIVGDGPERGRLEARAGALLGGRVRFTGMIPHPEMAARLGGATVYVSTSRSDSTSVSLLEAMAAGALPVVTDIEANREWIDDGVNGFLVPVGAADVLAARVLQALADPALLARAAAENKRRIDTRAIWEQNMALIEGRFAALARERSGG